MQNENNNSRNWKQKLENIEDFPADMRLNKEAAWNKLDVKLQHQPKRRKAFWYWVAACLLPLLLIPILHFNRDIMATNITHENAIKKPLIKETIPSQKELVIVKKIAPDIQKKKQVKQPGSNSNINNDNEVQTAQLNDDSIRQKITEIAAVKSDTNTVKAIASTQITTKLKVVHINELNEPATATPEMARQTIIHPFPIQIARGEVHGNDVKAIHTTSFISFKTKPLTN